VGYQPPDSQRRFPIGQKDSKIYKKAAGRVAKIVKMLYNRRTSPFGEKPYGMGVADK
jgi:hypothetical protein